MKTDAKKAFVVAKIDAYKRLYQKLESKEGEKEVFRPVRAKGRRMRDLGNLRCIQDEDVKVMIKDTKILERWQYFFFKLFNWRGLTSPIIVRKGVEKSNKTLDLASYRQKN